MAKTFLIYIFFEFLLLQTMPLAIHLEKKTPPVAEIKEKRYKKKDISEQKLILFHGL